MPCCSPIRSTKGYSPGPYWPLATQVGVMCQDNMAIDMKFDSKMYNTVQDISELGDDMGNNAIKFAIVHAKH